MHNERQRQLSAKNAALQNKIKDFEARPTLGEFESARGPAGALKSEYRMQDPFAGGAKASPWMNMLLEQQQMQEQQALNRGQRQAATAAASARANLARRGGLSGGAAERLAAQAEEQRALGAQDIFGQGAQQRLGMQAEDFAKERQYQTGLQQANIQNALQDLAQQREFQLKKYEEEMKGYGAEKSAQATEKASKGGTVICTALMDVGLVTPAQRELASKFKSEVSHEEYRAYLKWGTVVANTIRLVPAVGYIFRPLVRYWMGDRDLLATLQFRFFRGFNRLFVGKKHAVQI